MGGIEYFVNIKVFKNNIPYRKMNYTDIQPLELNIRV